ncbi:sodium:solute symporter [Oceanobacillus sp. Castelsardo]|uniref:sodium:solute symporter family transporter n=1 Tax=Oceanobacillus sp. Castelsardo TaxID=1851204 RepID=UPI000837E65C|nr:sodium:solute symporter [Oceanobacillus sp. Castelsardo]
MTGFDFFIVIFYFAVLISIGFISSRKIKNHADFVVAGRRLGYGSFIPAMAAVVLGGASTFGGTALGYQFGISGMWMVMMIGLGIVGLGLFFANRLSELKVFSVSELLANKFGISSRFYSAIVMVVYNIMVMVTSTIAVGVLFSTIFDWTLFFSIVVGGIVVVIYTLLGGMWAVTMTDVMQFWVMTIGLILILLPVSFFQVGGLEGLTSRVNEGFLSLSNMGWNTVFSYFLLYFFGMMIGQDVWQRAFTGRSKSVIRKGTIVAGIYCVIYGIAGALIGTIASVILPNLSDPQQALPALIINILPTGLIGLTIAAAISAAMSTASGTMMAASTVFVNDIIIPLKKITNEKSKIKLTRLMILIVGLTGIIIAAKLQNIVMALDLAYALLSGTLFIPIIIALFFRSIPKKVVLTSMLVSSLVVVINLMVEGITSLNAIIYGLAAGLLVVIIGKVLIRESGESKTT